MKYIFDIMFAQLRGWYEIEENERIDCIGHQMNS